MAGRHKYVTLRLSPHQADWLYYELLGNLADYTSRDCIQPEEETAVRNILADLELGLELAMKSLELELHRLRSITAPKTD